MIGFRECCRGGEALIWVNFKLCLFIDDFKRGWLVWIYIEWVDVFVDRVGFFFYSICARLFTYNNSAYSFV